MSLFDDVPSTVTTVIPQLPLSQVLSHLPTPTAVATLPALAYCGELAVSQLSPKILHETNHG
jgi:hypothetical protein